MIITGTVTTSDGTFDYLSAEAATYEEARAQLDALLSPDQKLIVIRTNKD